jgi:hypothetical protein
MKTAEVNLMGDIICPYCQATIRVEHPVEAGIQKCSGCMFGCMLSKEQARVSNERFNSSLPGGWKEYTQRG